MSKCRLLILVASLLYMPCAMADTCKEAIKLSKKKQYFHAHLVLKMAAIDGSQKSWAKATNDCLLGAGAVADMSGLASWLQLAANQGDTDAMVQLVFLYAGVAGVQRDFVKAQQLLSNAEEKGNESAVFFRPLLADAIKRAQ